MQISAVTAANGIDIVSSNLVILDMKRLTNVTEKLFIMVICDQRRSVIDDSNVHDRGT